MYLLDTNIVSELRKVKQGRADKNFVRWLPRTDKSLFYTNSVVLMEIQRGILQVLRRDPIQAEHLKQWYEMAVEPMFAERILTINQTTAAICAKLHISDRSPENDAWIAASAIQHDLTLVTRNEKDFQHDGLRVFNPFR